MMTRKLVVCATPTGVELGKKICENLNIIMRKEFDRLKDASPYSLDGSKFAIISHLREYNRRTFKNDDFALWPVTAQYFKSGEVKPVIQASVRGAEVFLIHQSYVPITPIAVRAKMLHEAKTYEERLKLLEQFSRETSVQENDHLAEFYINALKSDGAAHRVFLISPFFANSRQDHRRAREGLTSRTQITLFEAAGVNSLMFVDLHSQSLVGLSRTHSDNFHPTTELVSRFKALYPNYITDFVVESPDAGATKRTEHINEHYLNLPMGISFKSRDYTTVNTVNDIVVTKPELVKDKYAVVFDDIIDTANTLKALTERLCERFGCKGVVAIASHALLSDKGVDNIDELYAKKYLLKLITTDSVSRPPSFAVEHPWYEQVSLAPRFASMIYNIYMEQQVDSVHMD